MKPLRFPYARMASGLTAASELAWLPIRLGTQWNTVELSGLLDTGASVNVLPYPIGVELGLVWGQQTVPIFLTGNLSRTSAFGVIVTTQVESLPPVDLAFAWTQTQDIPLILGQVNFFMEFDVCFFRSQGVFEVAVKQ